VQPTPPPAPAGPTAQEERQQRQAMIIGGIVALVVVGLLITSLVYLLNPSLSDDAMVARIRDVFIIFMAFESLLIGGVLVILIVQLARLTNLLQNEIKPILDSTNETVSTLRGTTQFVSEHLSEPIIKLNEYVAALQKLLELLRLGGTVKK
jgi:hypothetical protein